MKKIIIALTLAAFGVVLAGCNTIQGVGKDVEKAGEKVQELGKK